MAAGLKRFFTGIPCRNGHVAERRANDGKCAECTNIRKRKWDELHEEKEAARKQKWRRDHPDADKQYHAKNRQRILERHLEYYRENKESRAAYDAQNAERIKAGKKRRYARKTKEQRSAEYQERKAQFREYWQSERGRQVSKASKKRHPESIRSHARNRRARNRAALGRHTGEEIVDIRRMQRDRCAEPSCRTKLHGKGHVDHIIPLARGGGNDRRNLQLLCGPCNFRKHAKDPIDFARELGRLL